MENKKSQYQDNNLIHNFIIDGDTNSFDKLVLKYQDMVYSLCYRVLGNYDDANDCAQETFVKVFKSLSKYKYKSSFSTWLYRITVNTCKNHLSSLSFRMKQKTVTIEGLNNDDSDCKKLEIKDNHYNPENIFQRKENELIIQSAVNSLSSTHKVLVVLRDFEKKSYAEIAEITGLKIGTIKSKLSRARVKLKKKLKGVL